MEKIPHKPHHFATWKVILLGIFFLVIALVSVWGTYYLKDKVEPRSENNNRVSGTPSVTEIPTETQVFCTMDAKVCPDGSSVGKVPPNCEFSACPKN